MSVPPRMCVGHEIADAERKAFWDCYRDSNCSGSPPQLLGLLEICLPVKHCLLWCSHYLYDRMCHMTFNDDLI